MDDITHKNETLPAQIPSSTSMLPQLPWDVLVHIVQLADTDTLAVIGRVSHDLLVTSVPLLYRDIEVDSVERLNQLFYDKADAERTPSSRLDSLAVFSHTRTLTVNVRDEDHQALRPSTSRFPNGRPLSLDSLIISWGHKSSIIPVRLVLLPIVNPARAVFRRRQMGSIWTGLPGSVSLDSWDKLDVLEFRGGILLGHDGIHRERIGGLPRPTKDRRRVVRLHVRTFLLVPFSQDLFLRQAFMHYTFALGFDGMQEGSIQLVVEDEEEKAATEMAVSNTIPEQYRLLFAVVVDS